MSTLNLSPNNPLDLGHQPPLTAAAHVAELAAVGYWAKKLADGDINHAASQGRIIPVVNTRSFAEKATVAAGQITVGHFLWLIFFKLVFAPLMIAITVLCLVPTWLLACSHAPAMLQVGVFLGMLVFYIYVVLWRMLFKGFICWCFRRL